MENLIAHTCKASIKIIAHNTVFFNWESLKLKTPNIYYVSWISCNYIIQSLVPQDLSTIQSSHTNQEQSCKSMHWSSPAASLPPPRNPSWLKIRIQCNTTLIDYVIIIGNSNVYVDAIHTSLIVTTDSLSFPFTYLSTGLYWNCHVL